MCIHETSAPPNSSGTIGILDVAEPVGPDHVSEMFHLLEMLFDLEEMIEPIGHMSQE